MRFRHCFQYCLLLFFVYAAFSFSGGTYFPGDVFRVNSYTTDIQIRSHVSMNREGRFVIAWGSMGQDGSHKGVYAQIYDKSGSSVGGELQVNSFTDGYQGDPSVSMNEHGDFVVAWESMEQDGS